MKDQPFMIDVIRTLPLEQRIMDLLEHGGGRSEPHLRNYFGDKGWDIIARLIHDGVLKHVGVRGGRVVRIPKTTKAPTAQVPRATD